MSGQLTTSQLSSVANKIRKNIISMVSNAGSGHVAGALGLADLFAALYFDILNYDKNNPEWKDRDVLFLSNGHVVPVQYAAMAEAGLIEREELKTLRVLGSRLQGHPERESLPFIEATSGPLGCGLSQAAGYAYAVEKLEHNSSRFCYAVMGDGELDEGNIWEAAMFAAKNKLSQLIGFVDRNNIQLSGSTDEIMPLENLHDKWASFGWHVQEVDGHNIANIIDSVALAKATINKPSVIILHTTAGKGVDFMEHDYRWHGNPPDPIQASKALEKLALLDEGVAQ